MRAFKKNNILNRVIIAKDGVEALDYLLGTGLYAKRNLKDLPVVILLDLKLPKIDGMEVLKRIRQNERTKLIPVVILTTSAAESDMVRAYDCHANSYLVKPVDFTQFIELMDILGYYWLILNHKPST